MTQEKSPEETPPQAAPDPSADTPPETDKAAAAPQSPPSAAGSTAFHEHLSRSQKRRKALVILGMVLLVAGVGVLAWYLLFAEWNESTDDAYVQGNQVQITPLVAGTVVAINADDGMRVERGQLLVQLDPADTEVALQQAVAQVTQMPQDQLKRIMRTGTVASTDNRNWELVQGNTPQRRFSQSRAVALDMESATIAANGFRFRVPYGTLLCVSDKPLHGEIKLPGMANHFYRERVDQHLRIGMRALEILRADGIERLHSRKLRSFTEVAFQ